MRPPCEIVVWYVIPTIRSELAKELLSLGMKQKEISVLLNITQPAVSQYVSDKRGHGIKFNEETHKLIKKFARGLVGEKYSQKDIIPHFCEICKKVKTDEILCQLHQEKGKMPSDCNACMSTHQND